MLNCYTKKELCEAIRGQVLVQCDELAAKKLAAAARCLVLKPCRTVIKENVLTDDVFFVLRGTVEVIVNGTRVATRGAGQHVGEMALLLHSRRTATVVTTEETILAKITREDFTRIANKCPLLWRNVARELAMRLHQRRHLLREPNKRPFIFIGSSGKHAHVAERLRDELSGLDADIQVWTDPGAFAASGTFIETLTAAAKRADFAILVFAKDDVQIIKGKKFHVPRDNVIFEAGLFIGGITRLRTFIVHQEGANIRILSDLAGVTLLKYRKIKSKIDVSGAAKQIAARVCKDWVR